MLSNKPDPDVTCPYTGHKQKCKKLYLNCPKWIRVEGKNPQTGADVSEYACPDTWVPILMIENSQQQRQTAAAVESFRNATIRQAQENRFAIPSKINDAPRIESD